MRNLVDEILAELEYISENGILDFSKPDQVALLEELLRGSGVNNSKEIAEKTAIYFTQLQQKNKKVLQEKQSLEKVLDTTFKNPDTGNDVKVSSALGYDKKSQAFKIAQGMLTKSGYSEKDIEMVDTEPEDVETPTNVFGKKGKGASVFAPETKPKDSEENQEGTYDPNNKLQRNVVEAKTPEQRMRALDEMGKDEESKMLDKVQAGAGGPVASTGETLCTEAQTDLIQGRYNPEKVKKSPEFKKEYDNIKTTLDGKPSQQKNKLIRELENICKKMGYITEDGQFDYSAAAMIKAEEQLYIKNNLPQFEKTNVAKQKFKSKEDMVSWMKASFYSSYSLMNNGPSDWDRKKGNGRVLKANSTTDGATRQVLQNGFNNAKSPSEKDHYKKQLQIWDKFKGYHDTYLVYTNDKGQTSVYHISNKKSDQLDDPQNNTTPEQRLRNYQEAVKERNLNPKEAEIVNKAQMDAVEASMNNDNIANTAYNRLKDDDIKLLSSLSGRLPARSQTDTKDEYYQSLKNDKKIKDFFKKKYGENWQDKYNKAKPDEIIGIAVEIAKNSEPSSLSQNFTKFIIKHGQLAQSIFEKQAAGMNPQQISESFKGIYSPKEIQSILASKTMKMLAERKKQHAAGLDGVHTGFINSLHEADGTKPGHTGENGPAIETYVQGTLKSLHIDTYITNYDESVQVEMGGVGCKPIDVRKCMAELSGFKGEIDSEKGRSKLINHLGKSVKVDADSDAVYLVGKDGKTRTYLASDTWRQAGSSKKIATAFGSNLRKCLSDRVAERNKNNRK